MTSKNGLSLVECDLITGRTHRSAPIRRRRPPLLGDGKYGRERDNKKYDRKFQALYSYKLKFDFTTDAGCLEPLNHREWTVTDVEFVEEYFPGYKIKI